jgi:exodeoxyribonuclease X
MLINDAFFAVWDTETTGLDPSSDRVVEVACVTCTSTAILGRSGTLVNPMCHIPAEASAVHHIVDRHVQDKATLEFAMLEFGELFEGRPTPPDAYVAHNAAFDAPFLPMLRRAPWLCTLRLARHLLPDLQKHTNQFLRYHFELEVPEAEGLAAHRAVADAAVMGRLLQRLLTMLPAEVVTVEQLVAFIARPVLLKTCYFGKHKGTLWAEVPKDYLQWMRKQADFEAKDPDQVHTVKFYLGEV